MLQSLAGPNDCKLPDCNNTMGVMVISTWSLNHVVPVMREGANGCIHNQTPIQPCLSEQEFEVIGPMLSVWYFDQYRVSYGN